MKSIQLSKIQMQDIVTKVRQSSTFKNATTNSALLQYLYDATLRGGNLKEDIINIEFYGKEDSVDKGNPRVRVNVANLRKKLELYYSDEGENDKWQIAIDKGQYRVSFVKNRSIAQRVIAYNWSLILPYFAIIILLGVLLSVSLPKAIPNPWRSVIAKQKVTNMYIGDMFGMSGTTAIGTSGWTRSFNINSYFDYNNLLKERPEVKEILEPSTYTYTTSMAVLATQRMQHFFQERGKEFQIRFASKSSTADIIEGNAIYVGSTGNDNRFINFFNEANPHCELSAISLRVKDHPTIKDTIYMLNTPADYEEYAIVSKYPAPNNTEHFVFFSRGDIGVTAGVEYFTHVDNLKEFVDEWLDGHKYFTVILRVKGHDRTNTSIEVETVILL